MSYWIMKYTDMTREEAIELCKRLDFDVVIDVFDIDFEGIPIYDRRITRI